MTKMLSDVVSVARRFQRSIRVDADLGVPDALSGFVCHESGCATLQTMASLFLDAGQRAFTWTGPYGGGKSSLALTLCAYVGGEAQVRRTARAVLGSVPKLATAFPEDDEAWLVVPVIGRRADAVSDIEEALSTAIKADSSRRRIPKGPIDTSGRALVSRLEAEAARRERGGVLLLIDEMGKFLEGAAAEGRDIQFFQELAEAANRCKGRLVVLGVLHQAFEQYASRLGNEARDEWAKVQGRYADIPVVTAVDEVIDLVGRAIVSTDEHPKNLIVAGDVAEAIRRRRPGSPADLAERLDRCWPLHPVTAAIIGPVSRRRFGQNERSTFGFLCSSEPEGLQEFLRATPVLSGLTYEPAQLWDYLRINLEPAILASPDGHRWAQGAEAVERVEARGDAHHVRLVKTIALIDLFRNGSGLAPEPAVLKACLPGVAATKFKNALTDLEEWSAIIFRKHLNAFCVYAGSDFDIDAAVQEAEGAAAEVDPGRLANVADLQPVLAKQHYYRTGTLRWFDTEIVSLNRVQEAVQAFSPENGSAGKFLLAIPGPQDKRQRAEETCRLASNAAGPYPIAVGLPRNAWLVRELGSELVALETVRSTRPELEGDSVARREVQARIAAVSAQLEEELRASFAEASWFVRGGTQDSTDIRSLSQLVSRLADETFDKTPIIHSELINREKPSSNSQAAVRLLLYAMTDHPSEPYLGIEGFPAERGLYSTVLEASGLHRKAEDGTFAFTTPKMRGPNASFGPMWRKAEELLSAKGEMVPLSALYDAWLKPPYGIRRGVLPVLAMAFILAHRSSLAVYAEGTFRPEIDRYFVDLLLQSETLIALRPVNLGGESEHILRDVANAVTRITGVEPDLEPLAVARALVRFMFNLPSWTRRASGLSEQAASLRRVLLTADDPYRALFVDLPVLFKDGTETPISLMIADALHELGSLYPDMLKNVRDRMYAALGSKSGDLAQIHERARTVSGLSGDLRLDAFAARLIEFDGSTEAMEGLAGMAINKPPRDWSDRDPDRAAIALAELALRFRQAETFAGVKGRKPTQHAIAVCFGTGENGKTIAESFNISAEEQLQARALSEALTKLLENADADRRVILAALAEAGAKTAEERDDGKYDECGRAAAS